MDACGLRRLRNEEVKPHWSGETISPLTQQVLAQSVPKTGSAELQRLATCWHASKPAVAISVLSCDGARSPPRDACHFNSASVSPQPPHRD